MGSRSSESRRTLETFDASTSTTLQTAIKSDSGVQTAETQLTTDTATITKDQAVLVVDMTQLQTDLAAQSGTGTGTASTGAVAPGTIMTSPMFGRMGRGRFGRM